jgi:hypothetical protein
MTLSKPWLNQQVPLKLYDNGRQPRVYGQLLTIYYTDKESATLHTDASSYFSGHKSVFLQKS